MFDFWPTANGRDTRHAAARRHRYDSSGSKICTLLGILFASVALIFSPAQAAEKASNSSADPAIPTWALKTRTSATLPLGTVLLDRTPSLAQAPRMNAV